MESEEELVGSFLAHANVYADFVLAVSYFSISAALFHFLRLREDMLFRKSLFGLGFLFLVTSVTHFLQGLVFWWPFPVVHGVAKGVASIFALGLALLVWHYMRTALRIPNQKELADSYSTLKQTENNLWASICLLEERVEERTRELESLSYSDPLTGVRNRRGIFKELQDEIDRVLRLQHPLSVLMVDLDDFKNINDTHGHQAGDQVLVAAADCMSKTSRTIDKVGRFGGEEFLIVLPGTTSEEALIVADRLCMEMAARKIDLDDGPRGLHFTCSVGVAQFDMDDDIDSLIKKADRALYEAKHQGKNQAVAGM